MIFQCDTTLRQPIYRQLIDQVRRAIATGKLKPGERLPSVRQLSRDLVVNPNTIAKAYTELERMRLLITQRGRGVFVAEPQTELTEQVRNERLTASIDETLIEAVHLGFSSSAVTALFQERVSEFSFVDCDRDEKQSPPAEASSPSDS